MHAFTLRTKKRQEFNTLRGCAAKPMRRAGVELRSFTLCEDEVPLSQHQAQLSSQHIRPFVPFMHLRIGVGQRRTARQHDFEGLQPAAAAAKWNVSLPMPLDRTQMNSGIARCRSTHQLIQRNSMRAGQRQQQLQIWPALSGFQTRERTNGNARGLRQIRQSQGPAQTQRLQARTNTGQNIFGLVTHEPSLPFQQQRLPVWRSAAHA